MTTRLRNRFMCVLAALLMVVGITLPVAAGAGLPCHHHHVAQLDDSHPGANQGHHHTQPAASHHHQSIGWHHDRQSVSCDACAICCCGAVLLSIAALIPGQPVSVVLLANPPLLFDGVTAARDPYPPKPAHVTLS